MKDFPVCISEPFNNDPSVIFEYSDADSFDDLEKEACRQSYGISFCEGKLLIVFGFFGGTEREWGFTGGRIDPGETYEQTLRREIQEESNMEVISFRPIGYQKVIKTKEDKFKYELRYVCKVRPLGPFVSDPADGVISEIKLIDPSEYKKYVDWGKIGDRLVERALELLPTLADK